MKLSCQMLSEGKSAMQEVLEESEDDPFADIDEQ